MGFSELLRRRWEASGSLLCVGLDPDPDRIPAAFGSGREAILRFCEEMISATAEFACAFKPQVAYFAASGAEAELERLCHGIRERHPDIPVILDAKRGDIGDTARMYAREAFDRYGAHAVTVNPWMGTDTIEPFLSHPAGAAIVLCRTSNPGSAELQSRSVDGMALFEHVARTACETWSRMGDVSLVVGATWPAELARVRALTGDMTFLVPGVGAQGGDPAEVVRNGRNSIGTGLVVNSSRAILYASAVDPVAEAARVARETRDALNAAR